MSRKVDREKSRLVAHSDALHEAARRALNSVGNSMTEELRSGLSRVIDDWLDARYQYTEAGQRTCGRNDWKANPEAVKARYPAVRTLDEVKADYVREILTLTDNNRTHASILLDMPIRTMRNFLKRMKRV